MSSVQYCGSCGETLIERASFCRSCGASLNDSKYGGVGAVSSELPMVSFIDALKLGFRNYVKFSGRSTPAELWWWVLFCFLNLFPFRMLIAVLEGSGFYFPAVSLLDFLNQIIFYGSIIPSLAVGSRRLHDINKSSWWLLLVFVPVVGWVVLIVWCATAGDRVANKYGPNPRTANSQRPYKP